MPGNTWEDWEIARLRALLAQGFSASEMVIGDRTPAAIQNKASRLQFVGDGIQDLPQLAGLAKAASDEAVEQIGGRRRAQQTHSEIGKKSGIGCCGTAVDTVDGERSQQNPEYTQRVGKHYQAPT